MSTLAPAQTSFSPPSSPPRPATTTQPPGGPRRFTVDEYHRMIRAGVLTEDDAVELLEGWVIYKMARDPQHDITVKLAEKNVESKLPGGWHYRAQLGITTGDSEPEPDGAVVLGEVRDYAHSHPQAPQIALVIEVANSSLASDREIKGRLYARAGIPVYWIINLIDGVIEVFSDPSGPVSLPSYRQRRDLKRGEQLSLQLPGGQLISVAVSDLLP